MLGKLLKPFTTATAGGTVFRDFIISAGSIVAILGLLGLLTPEQQAAIEDFLKQISSPAMTLALGSLAVSLMSIYRALFMSSSDKAAKVAKEVDAKIDPGSDVVIKTPAGVPDIVVKDKSGP